MSYARRLRLALARDADSHGHRLGHTFGIKLGFELGIRFRRTRPQLWSEVSAIPSVKSWTRMVGVPVPIIMEAIQSVPQSRRLERIEEQIVETLPQMLNIVGALQPVPWERSYEGIEKRIVDVPQMEEIEEAFQLEPSTHCGTDCRILSAGSDVAQLKAAWTMVVGPCWTRPSVKPESCWPSNWRSSRRTTAVIPKIPHVSVKTCVGVLDQHCFDCRIDVEQQTVRRCAGCRYTTCHLPSELC